MDLVVLTPEWTLAAFALAVIILDLFIEEKRILAVVSVIGLAVTAGVSLTYSIGYSAGISLTSFSSMLIMDDFALFFKLLFTGTAILVVLSSMDYISKLEDQGEYYALILLATLGMMLMAAAGDLITIYVSLELTSITLYILVGFLKDRNSTEASLKYLLLGAVASAVLLYGMAMVFGFTGQTQLSAIGNVLGSMSSLSGAMSRPGLVIGVILMLSGLGFKIAAVPFQMWVPDVYQGAPTPITAFLSVGSKAAGFALILRVFISAFGFPTWLSLDWGMIFAVLAVISMIVGNVAAIPQSNIKRMLGYSSIAQAGYLMVGLAAVGLARNANTLGESGILFFLVSYAVTNMGAFIAIIAITNKLDSDLIENFAGMGKRAPLLALSLTLCLISLVGMPPAAGFMAKYYIFSGAVENGLLWLVIIAVINSVISAYYYLRVVKVMWFGEAASEEGVPSSWALRIALIIAAAGVLLLGIFPGYLIHTAQLAARFFIS